MAVQSQYQDENGNDVPVYITNEFTIEGWSIWSVDTSVSPPETTYVHTLRHITVDTGVLMEICTGYVENTSTAYLPPFLDNSSHQYDYSYRTSISFMFRPQLTSFKVYVDSEYQLYDASGNLKEIKTSLTVWRADDPNYKWGEYNYDSSGHYDPSSPNVWNGDKEVKIVNRIYRIRTITGLYVDVVKQFFTLLSSDDYVFRLPYDSNGENVYRIGCGDIKGTWTNYNAYGWWGEAQYYDYFYLRPGYYDGEPRLTYGGHVWQYQYGWYGWIPDTGGVDPDPGGDDPQPGGDEMKGPGVDCDMFTVYLVEKPDLSMFSGWLWNYDVFGNLKRLYYDPMDAIISWLGFPLTLTGDNIVTLNLGNLNSGIRCYQIENTIINLNCGEIQMSETFNSVLDYEPYTTFEIYLPYIGFKSIKTDDIMGGSVSVSYNIDLTTGICEANVTCTKSNNSIVMYTYSGNCGVQLPLTSANYNTLKGNLISAGLSIGSSVISGGMTTPLAVGAVGNAALNSKISVERSGNIVSNSGLLSYHKPYLVCSRPVPAQATNFEQYYGFPTNQLVLLSACSGYTRVKDCKLTGFNATEKEKIEIENLLKEGVFI